jgi:hypothetical protein
LELVGESPGEGGFAGARSAADEDGHLSPLVAMP